jgi:hypothetical protein
MKMKSVKSIHPCKSVVQTIYDIVKAHGGELKVETKEREVLPSGQAGSVFTISLPIT